MASQSVRIVGLLMLSWRLRHLGAKRLEIYALWLSLVIVLGMFYLLFNSSLRCSLPSGLVFAVNATGTGAARCVLTFVRNSVSF